MSSYTAEVHREGRRWLVAYVPEIGHATQGRSLQEIEYMVRDLVRQCTDDDHHTATINFFVEEPRLQKELAAARAARSEAADAAQRAAERSRQVARDLKAAGFTVRDIGTLLGVTFQRAHQLLRGREG